MAIALEDLRSQGYKLATGHTVDKAGRALALIPRLSASIKALDAQCARWNQQLWHHRKIPEAGFWLVDNQIFLQGQAREVREFLPQVYYGELPRLADGPLAGYPRVYSVAVELVLAVEGAVTEEAVTVFVQGYEQQADLSMGELWALGAMLRLALLEELGALAVEDHPDSDRVRNCVLGLRTAGSMSWKDFFEETSAVERILRTDPAGVYPLMDFATRDMYRHALASLAHLADTPEPETASRLVEHAAAAPGGDLHRHVGYYLVDDGLAGFQKVIGCRTPWQGALRRWVLRRPEFFYLAGIELATFGVIALLLSRLSSLEPRFIAFWLLFLPATGAAVALMNQIVTLLLPPRRLPRLDFSEGIPKDCNTMIVVPTLLFSGKFITQLLEDLEVRFLANRDPQLSFGLLTDFPDAPEPAPDDQELVEQCAEGIRALNQRYGHSFYLFHRAREWNPRQFTFMGWERKRGKLIHFNNLLCGEGNGYTVTEGDLSVLPRVRYVLTLDTDTQVPRDAARKLVATIAHPLNRPVVDPVTRTVVRGYGILQPRVGISVHSAGRSRLARIYSGQTGIDLYTTAVSDVYQDLFAAGIYTGKGLYDVRAFQQVLAHRFPHDALLSHDLLEGEYARAGLVTDIEVIDDYPSHYGAYSKRKHRWVRGDWQVILWMLPRVPQYDGSFGPNPLPLISRWKIFDNLRRSLIEITTFLLLVAGWTFLPGGPRYWSMAVIAMLVLPAWVEFLLTVPRLPKPSLWGVHFREAGFRLIAAHLNTALTLTFLAHQALLMVDAIVRTIVRTITRHNLLEWESAAEAESTGSGGLHRYLWISAVLSAGLIAVVGLLHSDAVLPSLPVIATWVLAPVAAIWLNAVIRPARGISKESDVTFLMDVAERTWSYFETFCTAADHWLIPDNFQQDSEKIARRISPTNLGLQLNANLAALDLGLITVEGFVTRTRHTLDTMERLETFRGHFHNWYETGTLEASWPGFVSTVDSGNLAAALITLKQGSLEYASSSQSTEVETQLRDIAGDAGRWFENMDFSFLYNRSKKLLSTGMDIQSGRLDGTHYDLLASEARAASFLAIAKGDIPQEHWFHLGRTMTSYGGHRVLLSWSGTMFEYLMPSLWMKNWPGTLLDRATRTVIRCQQTYAKERRIPWGVSESAFLDRDSDGNYQYHAFGLPPLALRNDHPDRVVIAPYAAALALPINPRAALKNLRLQSRRGWLGDYGYYDAIQFNGDKGEPVRSFMAHHLGMTLVAIDNAIHCGAMQRRFHADPIVQAVELLLQERVPAAAWVAKTTGRDGNPVIPHDTESTNAAAR
ncbi:MAG: glucoamylase family protein [Bryobacteraceae bacterium]